MCAWDSTLGTPACVLNSATNCAKKTGTALTDTLCVAYNAACTSNTAATAC